MSLREYIAPDAAFGFAYPDSWKLVSEASLQLLSPAGSAITWSRFRSKLPVGDRLGVSKQPLAGQTPGVSWTFMRRQTMLMVTYFAEPAAMVEEQKTLESIMGSVRIDELLPSARRFADAALERLRDGLPGTALDLEGFGIEVAEHGTFDLTNAFLDWQNDEALGWSRVDAMIAFLSQSRELAARVGDWAFAKTRTFPLLISAAASQPGRVTRPGVGPLLVAYMVDAGPVAAPVVASSLSAWGVSPQELHELAIANLDALGAVRAGVAETPFGPLVQFEPFTFATGYLLLPRILAKLAGQLGSPFLVALPARDVFMAAADSPTGRDALANEVGAIHASASHALTASLFLADERGLRSMLGA
jgi:hypothetical protein